MSRLGGEVAPQGNGGATLATDEAGGGRAVEGRRAEEEDHQAEELPTRKKRGAIMRRKKTITRRWSAGSHDRVTQRENCKYSCANEGGSFIHL
jgi:hypothetical protein